MEAAYMRDYEKMFWILERATMYAVWQLEAGFHKMAWRTLQTARDQCKALYGDSEETIGETDMDNEKPTA